MRWSGRWAKKIPKTIARSIHPTCMSTADISSLTLPPHCCESKLFCFANTRLKTIRFDRSKKAYHNRELIPETECKGWVHVHRFNTSQEIYYMFFYHEKYQTGMHMQNIYTLVSGKIRVYEIVTHDTHQISNGVRKLGSEIFGHTTQLKIHRKSVDIPEANIQLCLIKFDGTDVFRCQDWHVCEGNSQHS